MQNKKTRSIYWSTWSISLDRRRSIYIDRPISQYGSIDPVPRKVSQIDFLVFFDYIRIDSHLIWTDQIWFQLFKIDFFGMKPIISHSRTKGEKIKVSPKFINPNSLNFTLIWTILRHNPYDFVSFLRIYHTLVRSTKVRNSISTSFKSLKIER